MVSRFRNPDWSRDETILLMDLYLRASRAGKGHPEVLALSEVLRAAGRRDGRAVLETFRNPAGIAMRLRNFGRHDPATSATQDAGLRPGGVIDAEVWRAFGDDRQRLKAEVSRIHQSIQVADWRTVRRSRGPAPSVGPRMFSVEDCQTAVYMLQIDGPLDLLAPGVYRNELWGVVKLGRTSDLGRRVAELGSGLPPAAKIKYTPIALRFFPTAAEAHRFEQWILDLCERQQWTLGGEFAYAPLDDLRRSFSEHPREKTSPHAD